MIAISDFELGLNSTQCSVIKSYFFYTLKMGGLSLRL